MRRWLWMLAVPWLLAGGLLARGLIALPDLPERVVIHFDRTGQPDGWLPPFLFLVLMAAFLACELLVFTFLLLWLREDRSQFLALLAFFHIFTAAEVSLFWQVLEFNLSGRSMGWTAVAVATAALGVAPAALLVITSRRWAGGDGGGPVLAEEIHRSSRRFWINLPFCMGLAVAWSLAPDPLWKGVVVLLAFVVGYFMWLIWAGFRYRFHAEGVEIAGPLGRLEFIPATEILGGEVRPIRPLAEFGGWGIRGAGRRRAYVWEGRRALCLRLRRGEVYLGHAEPERLLEHLSRALLPGAG